MKTQQLDYFPYITGRENLIDSIGVRITPEKKNVEIPMPTTVPQAEYGPDVYVLYFIPKLEENRLMRYYKNPCFVINHDYDPEIPGRNPHKIPDPNLTKLVGQFLPDHRRHR